MGEFAFDDNNLVLCLIVTVCMQLFFFAIANTFKFDKVTDFAGSMNFVLLAWLTYLLTDLHYDRQLVNTLLVTAWGLRLGVFLLYRVLLRGHDARFDKMRDDCMKFFVFWVFQMFWVYIVSLPVMFLNAAELDSPINGWDYFGWALWAFGFLFESWADFSKNSHSNDPAMKGKILMSGPWAITRHPNYFGEIIIWLGIFISASQVFQDNTEWGYISLLSPAFTYFLLMFASGVPLGEDRYDKRYGTDPEYIDYKLSTPVLIPFPGAVYRSLPSTLKYIFCCDYDRYYRHFQADRDGIEGKKQD